MIRDANFTTKQWQYGIVETEKYQFQDNELDTEDHCEDVTDLLFGVCEELGEGETLCQPGFDLQDTMNGFELMDPKMDNKCDLESSFSPQKAKEAGTIKETYSNNEVLAILNLFLIQEVRWLKGNAPLATIYSFQLLADSSYYSNNDILDAYLKYLIFFEYELVEIIRTTGCVRDDEFTFPPVHEKKHTCETLVELLKLLDSVIEKTTAQGADDPILLSISNHLQFRRSIIYSVMMMGSGANCMKENTDESEQKPVSKNKKKKKNKKKRQAKKELDPLKESEESISAMSEKSLPAIRDAYGLSSEEDIETAKKLFDPTIMKSANIIMSMTNRDNDLSYDHAIEYFDKLLQNLKLIIKLNTFQFTYQISHFLKNLHIETPCALVRALAEKIVFPDNNTIRIFGKFDMHSEFMRDYVVGLFPNFWSYFDDKVVRDFLFKFSLMTREGLLRQMRNISNQQKNLKRYYEDLSILINEANFTDDRLISKKKYPGKQTTPCLTISINLVVEAMAEFLKLGFPLDLYAPYEFAMISDYLSSVFRTLQNNRRIMILGFCEDQARGGKISFENNEENKEFMKHREKMSDLQKITCDEFVFYHALREIYSGLTILFMVLMKDGHIKNPLRGKFGKEKGENFIERNAYRRRFYLFKYLNFPRYNEYEDYEETYDKVFNDETGEQVNIMRENLMQGMKLLNQIKGTDEKLRNTTILSTEMLEEVCKIAANNLFVLMKAQSAPEGKKTKIVINPSNEWLPQVDVEYV
ncbi:unnamed protein product [Moneuplotes crassus]|uniref:Uncharacterized protein n=1 Tax=Euplotes crassus TaxID=5936 RepID=A0AAD1Y994_EUPCR|nr:unnamed protein product [Moneuplotes crassus]